MDRRVVAAAWVCVGLALPGCVTAFDRHREHLEGLHAQGRFDEAAAELDDARTVKLYGDHNGLLWDLERGAAAFYVHDHGTAFALLERAEHTMEATLLADAGSDAARWLINDTAAPYGGRVYEDLYVNVFKLLGHLEEGSVEGAATVEARRLIGKANRLRDKYLKMGDTIARRGNEGFRAALSRGAPIDTSRSGAFVESPLGVYLTALTFMAAGDRDSQRVAARRLTDSILGQRDLFPRVSPTAFDGLGEMTSADANVVIVGLSGRGPTLRAARFGPIPVYDWPVYFELPVMEGGSAEAAGAFVEIEGQGRYDLDLIEEFGRVAAANHEAALPGVYARTLLRASLKAGASFAATQAVRHNSDDDLATIAAILGGLAFVALTEKADLRTWELLPGRAHVLAMRLAPGEHRVRVAYTSAAGGVIYTGPWRTVTATERGLVAAVETYWR